MQRGCNDDGSTRRLSSLGPAIGIFNANFKSQKRTSVRSSFSAGAGHFVSESLRAQRAADDFCMLRLPRFCALNGLVLAVLSAFFMML